MSRVQQQSRLPQEHTSAPIATKKPSLDEILENSVRELDAVAREYEMKLAGALQDRMTRMLNTARGVTVIRKLLTDALMDNVVMPLMNSDLGFKTDKADPSKGFYSREEVREVVIVALLQGFLLTGNEFNIIAGRFYGAQTGYYRKVTEVEGLTDLEVIPGIPRTDQQTGTTIRVAIKCRLDGKPWSLKDQEGKEGRVFSIRVNAGMGTDAIIGKAKRKALKAAFEEITLTKIADEDEQTTEAPPQGRLPIVNGSPEPQDNGNNTAPPTTQGGAEAGPGMSNDQDAEIAEQMARAGVGPDWLNDKVHDAGAKKYKDLSAAQADGILAELRGMPDKSPAKKGRLYADV